MKVKYLDAFGEDVLDAVLLLDGVGVGVVEGVDLSHEGRGGLGYRRRHFRGARFRSGEPSLKRLDLLAKQLFSSLDDKQWVQFRASDSAREESIPLTARLGW